MTDTFVSLVALLISPMMFGIFSLDNCFLVRFRLLIMKVLLPLRRISNVGSGDTMLQSTMTETTAVRMTLVLQPDHKFEIPYTHA